MMRPLPGRRRGLNEGPDGADRNGLDQPAQSCGQQERPLPLQPGVIALPENPDQQLDVWTKARVETGRPIPRSVKSLADQLTDEVEADAKDL
eukprot:12075962-Alexandrium_andersonii.AAC.1